MYHHSASRRGGRTGHRATTHSPAQPSSAAAKAAAAAKALHRRAQVRALEKQQQSKQQRSGEEQGCCLRIRNHPDPRNDVFRRSPHGSQDNGGSILKRLTAGNNQRFRIGPSTERVGGDNLSRKPEELELSVQREAGNDNVLEATAPKYLNQALSPGHEVYPYPPPVTGTSGAYSISSGPFGHPQTHLSMHQHGHPYPASDVTVDDRESKVDGANHKANLKITLANQPDDEDQHKNPNPRYRTTPMKALHFSAPCPYFEGGFLDPLYPHGAHPTHYPPGYYSRNAEALKGLTKDDDQTSKKKQLGCHCAETTTVKSDHISNPPPPSRSMRCIIGSHTPIHVPRATMHEMEEPLPYRRLLKKKVRSDPGSVFRSSEKSSIHTSEHNLPYEDDHDLLCESSAHKILLSLSKSFDRVEEGKHFSQGVPSASFVKAKENRPNSPDEPPRIQHWHKQSSDSFEPQPSPLKLSYVKDGDGINIDLTSSFTLFNESFDMNLEGLLGPNASFGFGPMRSLSFGLGLGTSVDHSENPRTASMIIHKQNSKIALNVMEADSGTAVQEDVTTKPLSSLEPGRVPVNLQILRASPSSSFGNVVRASSFVKNGSSSCIGVVHSSKMSLSESRCAGSPSVEFHHGHSIDAKESKTTEVTDDSTNNHQLLRTTMAEGNLPHNESRPYKGKDAGDGYDFNTEKQGQQHLQKIEWSLFGAMERHTAVFNTFSFLLPGAKTILTGERRHKAGQGNVPLRRHTELTEREKEVARRRVNSALCAFGGVVIPPADLDVEQLSKKACRRQKYKESFPERYYEDESRLSWEIEEDPPIEVSDSDEDTDLKTCSERKASDDDQKFHCKLCGTSKRDHECSYKASLQRSIGVMVYPAVNAFTATEPGIITAALSEMNNFVDRNKPPPESTPGKMQSELSFGTGSFLPMVSPDCIRPGTHTSPSSSLLMDRKTPQRSVNYAGGAWISNHQSPRKVSPGKSSDGQSTDLLFVDMQELRPEQYRIVAQKKRKQSSTRYLYSALPLPYGQRKRISNAMFAMSKSIPGLTDECASVLGEARQKDAWDFAVAQLMTQVIVVTHCSVEDVKLDGLSKYLLTLGIAC
mmetsp:Transcript_23913/g.51644  ORF Transcript_23913/g.51644 Transcript_23913/m.51644 type:complete len:1094 (+) Transcript_23913:109-3390(+)